MQTDVQAAVALNVRESIGERPIRVQLLVGGDAELPECGIPKHKPVGVVASSECDTGEGLSPHQTVCDNSRLLRMERECKGRVSLRRMTLGP
jgi:hypothetical protein